MRHLGKKLLAASILASFGGLAAGGCADNESMLFIVGVIVPEPPPDCTVTPDEGATIRQGGLLDVAFTTTYTGSLLIGNQLTRRGSRDEIKTESSRITIRGAEVQIFTPQQTLISEYTVAATGFVNESVSSDAAYGSSAVTLIDPATGAGFANSLARGETSAVVVEVRVFGDSLGGSEITSAKLTYPITICNECTLICPPKDPSLDVPCRVGNDDVLDCAACAAPGNRCQALLDASGREAT